LILSTRPKLGKALDWTQSVFGYVKQSGGHVKIYSEVDKNDGKIYLPKHLGDALAAKPVDRAAWRYLSATASKSYSW